ncbi:MAG: cobalamin-binding protein [Planctomycetota bacterium]
MTDHTWYRTMKKWAVALLLLALLAVALSWPQHRQRHELSSGRALRDALGRQVYCPRSPQRIVSLAPSATELLFALGAGNRVVGNTFFCCYPPEAVGLPKVGGYSDPDIERIISLKPDLVVGARGNPLTLFERITQLNVPCIALASESLDDVLANVTLLGQALGEEVSAANLVAAMRKRLECVATKMARSSVRPCVLFLFSLDKLISAGKGSHIDELINRAGGQNIASESDLPWPEIPMEIVLLRDPEVIILMTPHGKKDATTSVSVADILGRDSRWAGISAVKNKRVTVIDDDLLAIPGPRLIDGLEHLTLAIHPELGAQKYENE